MFNHKHKEDEDELYQISKEELWCLLCYTACMCMYAFCIILIYRRVFLMRPAIKDIQKKLNVVILAPPESEKE